MGSWKGCFLWCVVVGAEISLLSNLTLKLPHFLDSWNAPSLLWGRLVMLSGRYSKTVPESGLSPRWWRYGNQLSNGWITAAVDKDSQQNQMLLERFHQLGVRSPGAVWRRRRRPTVKGGTEASLSDTRAPTTEEQQSRRRRRKSRGKKENNTERERGRLRY